MPASGSAPMTTRSSASEGRAVLLLSRLVEGGPILSTSSTRQVECLADGLQVADPHGLLDGERVDAGMHDAANPAALGAWSPARAAAAVFAAGDGRR